LEEAQYSRRRIMSELGPDAGIMLRHDWTTLRRLPLGRQIAAVFAADLRGAIMSAIEMTLVDGHFHDPRAGIAGSYDRWGDHIGHTARLGAGNQADLATVTPYHPSALDIRGGFGSVEVRGFLRWAAAHQVRVIGGLPTGFDDSPVPTQSLAAIRRIYRDGGAAFLELPNRSRYPRSAFFDTADHLNEQEQIIHSKLVGAALAALEWPVTGLTQAVSR
jgi:hypothetical protein